MQRNNIISYYLLSALLCGLLAITACKEQKQKVKAQHTGFCIGDSLMEMIEIDTAILKEVKNELRLTGKITFNEDKVVRVFPFAGGVIEDLKVELGDYVKKGQVLALIRSSEIVDFENQLLVARSNLDVARKNLQVAEDMYKGNLSSEKELIMAKNDVQKSIGDYERIQQILKIYGEGLQHGIYAVKAPISGYIVEKNVTENMQFRTDNTENLFTISDLQHLWVVAGVYESDISKVKLDQQAVITTIAYPDIKIKGKVNKIFNVLDDQSRIEKIKIEFENTQNILKPEMFAYVILNIPEEERMIEIPSTAVIFDNSKNFTLVYKDKCHIEIKEITIHKNISGQTYVSSGLSVGDKVISSNQLLIYNALTD